MEYSRAKKLKSVIGCFDGLLRNNPVLVAGFGIPFAVVCTNSLKSAAALSVAMICTAIPAFLLASLLGRHTPAWVRLPVTLMMSAAILIPIRQMMVRVFPASMDSIGIYFSLMAINSIIILVPLSRKVTHAKPYLALLDAVFYSAGFAGVLFAVSFVRELLGNGTLWGIPMNIPVKSVQLLAPFGGFIVLAFFAAALQAFNRFCRRVFHHAAAERARRPKKAQAAHLDETV